MIFISKIAAISAANSSKLAPKLTTKPSRAIGKAFLVLGNDESLLSGFDEKQKSQKQTKFDFERLWVRPMDWEDVLNEVKNGNPVHSQGGRRSATKPTTPSALGKANGLGGRFKRSEKRQPRPQPRRSAQCNEAGSPGFG